MHPQKGFFWLHFLVFSFFYSTAAETCHGILATFKVLATIVFVLLFCFFSCTIFYFYFFPLFRHRFGVLGLSFYTQLLLPCMYCICVLSDAHKMMIYSSQTRGLLFFYYYMHKYLLYVFLTIVRGAA